MDIKNVALNHQEHVPADEEIGTNGQPLYIPEIAESFTFEVTVKDGTKVYVPNDPSNRHYWEVKNWYDEQDKKPFKFKFESM